jgi:hypothetical protein
LQYWSGKTRRPGCAGCGNSWIAVTPDAEQQTPLPGAQIADHAIAQLANFSARGIGTQGASSSSPDATTQPFFLAVGFHKPHLPFVAPERFFQSYPLDEINLPEDQDPPTDMPPVAWSSWGELRAYLDIAALGNSGQPGDHLPANVTKALRRAYYAAVTWTDYNVGRVLAALDMYGYTNNTVVTFWGDHGWQLGEHGEWCKHTNFDLATNAPMFVHVPGRTNHGVVSSTPTEFVDLMPTLVEAAMPGVTVPPCPADTKQARHKWLCTQGTSLLPLIDDPDTPVRMAAYSQYPRGYVRPGEEHLFRATEAASSSSSAAADTEASAGATGHPSASACLTRHCTMGYSMLTVHQGTEYRYTEWVDFNTVNQGAPDWNRVVSTELYDHANDPLENKNLAGTVDAGLKGALSALLHDHPVSGVAAVAAAAAAVRAEANVPREQQHAGEEAEADPNKWCSHPSDCAADEVCCLCNCAANDAAIGVFGCHCKSNGMPEPASQQTHCCGGESGFEAWCAKANTPSAANPKCNTTWSVFGVPAPASAFYKYGQHRRCVKQSKGCNAGYCDNNAPDAQHRGLCNRL